MKKFSKYTNSPVGEEIKKTFKINEEDAFKYKVLKLMDDLLRVQTYGPITRYQVAGTMKVAGKELFLEALLDLMSEKESSNDIKLLESLKVDIQNHEVIDKRIDKINDQRSNLHNQRIKIKDLYNRYKSDEEMLIEKVKASIDKISNEERNLRYLACDELKKDINISVLEKIKSIYEN
jgi:hypothetical protein